MIKDGNYIVIQSFMVTDLKLKGTELLVYAIIYGFSQANHKFNGSLQYIADWTNSTKQSVINNLKKLQEKGLIEKESTTINNVKFCEYYTKDFNGYSKNLNGGGQKILMGGSQKILPNNIYIDNIDNNINNNIYIVEIIDYLNNTLNSNYRATTKKTKSLINARLKEGFTVDDFKTVINNKYREWKNTDFEKFLRPETLFGTKFESYLNQKTVIKQKVNTNNPFLKMLNEERVNE